MRLLWLVTMTAVLAFIALPVHAGDDVLDAMDQARKAYQAGDLTQAKQSLDLASQLVGQKNAERFSGLLPEPLPGWKAAKPETTSVGIAIFGASTASRHYTNANDGTVEVRITGDSLLVTHFAQLLLNPTIASIMGKLIDVGSHRALQTTDGSINLVIANKFLVTVEGSADADAKLAYARAVDVDKLAKM
jgi:hypothetical protein